MSDPRKKSDKSRLDRIEAYTDEVTLIDQNRAIIEK